MATEIDRLVVRVEADLGRLKTEFLRLQRLADDSGKRVQGAFRESDASAQRLTASVAALRASFAALGVGIVARKVVGDFRQFERSLVGVGKTADLEGAALQALGRNVDDLSLRLKVVDAEELLGIAQSAGQLGVQGSANILKFTETVAKLGQASDLQGQEAATSLARILNVTGENIGEVDRLASIIVSLGNNFAATEREIARHTNEVSRATAQFDIGSTAGSAFGATLAAIGVRAELGGSVIGRTFRAINDAVKGGGDELVALQGIMGQTAEQIRSSFEADSVQAVQDFLAGLGRLQSQGGNVSAILESLGLAGDEVNKVLPVLANRTDLLGRALELAAAEAKNASALNTEFARVLDTLDAKIEGAQRNFESASRSIGEKLAPSLGQGIEVVGEAALGLADNLDLVAVGLVGLAGRGLGPIIQSNARVAASFVQQEAAAISAARAQLAVTAANAEGARVQVRMAQATALATGDYRGLRDATLASAAAQRVHNAALVAASVRARAATLAVAGLRSVMAFFGGPIGLAITGVAVGYLVLSRHTSAAEKAARLHEEAIKAVNAALSGSDAAMKSAAERALELAEASAIETEAEIAKTKALIESQRVGAVGIEPATQAQIQRLERLNRQLEEMRLNIAALRDPLAAFGGRGPMIEGTGFQGEDEPAGGGAGIGALSDDAEKARDRILELASEVSNLASQLRAVESAQGLDALNLTRDAQAAQEALRDLSSKDLATLEAALRASGVEFGNLSEFVASLVTQERELGEAIEARERALEEGPEVVKQARASIDALKAEIVAINQGEAAYEAYQGARAIANNTSQLRASLEAVGLEADQVRRLTEEYRFLAEAKGDATERLERLTEELRENERAAEDFAGAIVGGLRDARGEIESVEEALTSFADRIQRTLEEVVIFTPLQELLEKEFSKFNIGALLGFGEEAAPATPVPAGVGADPLQDAADKLAAALEVTSASATSAASGLDITSAAGGAAGDVLGNQLVQEALNSALAATQEAAASTTVTSVMTQLAAAAQAAAAALQQVAASAGSGGGGGGGLGFLGNIFSSTSGSSGFGPQFSGTGLEGLLSSGSFASGGDPRIGLPAIVGERGPELVVPKIPTRVFNAAQTRSIMAGGGGGASDVFLSMSVTINGRITAAERAENIAIAREMGLAAVNEFRASVNRGGPDATLVRRR